MHPREGKDKWLDLPRSPPVCTAASCPTAPWCATSPAGWPGDPGLMQYGDVVVFLHEFGHLMHHVIGGQNRFVRRRCAFFVEG